MKKNSQLHLYLETKLRQVLGEQAAEREITISELCRQKLRQNDRLDKIEKILEELLEREQKKIFKDSCQFRDSI